MEVSELSKIVDRYQERRNARLATEKIARDQKLLEDADKEIILHTLRKADASSVGGTTHNAVRRVTNEPFAEDWDAVHAYIIEHDAWELMHKQLTSSAVKERWDAGEEIPGVDSFPVEKLGLVKL